MRRASVLLVLVAVLAALTPGTSSAASLPTPQAHRTRSVPGVGAVYYPSLLGLGPRLGGSHYCTASVVHSRTRDLLVTAAHCVFGPGASIEFVPQLHGEHRPHGIWSVTALYVDPRWTRSFDPRHDVAFLRVAPHDGHRIEDVVTARPLGHPQPGKRVRVTGYPMGRGGRPVTCATDLRDVRGYSGVRCRGFRDGTSGGPWVQHGRVVGVVGGLQQGGCGPNVEYSTPFGASVRRLFRRAQADGPGDVAPVGFTANAC